MRRSMAPKAKESGDEPDQFFNVFSIVECPDGTQGVT